MSKSYSHKVVVKSVPSWVWQQRQQNHKRACGYTKSRQDGVFLALNAEAVLLCDLYVLLVI